MLQFYAKYRINEVSAYQSIAFHAHSRIYFVTLIMCVCISRLEEIQVNNSFDNHVDTFFPFNFLLLYFSVTLQVFSIIVLHF